MMDTRELVGRLTEQQIETLIENSGGYWREDHFVIVGAELSEMLQAAAAAALTQAEAHMRGACHDAAEKEMGCFRAVRAERLLAEAEAQGYRRGLEDAAKVCENNAVIGNTPTATGYRAVLMETNAVEYNVAGVCYAAAIRAKLAQDGKGEK